jgi:hypothetical protein
MGQVTHDQANLMLRLYELRREPRMREARDWFVMECHASSPQELLQKFPPGSPQNASYRMVMSYWEMVTGMVNRGLIDDEFFFENGGEGWVVYDRIRPMLAAMREANGAPNILANLESYGKRFEAWREKIAPGANERMRERMRQFAEMRAKAKP